VSFFGASFSVGYWVPKYSVGSSHEHLDMVHTYPWDPGIWLYTLITSVDDNAFIRGVECQVAREVVEVIECKVY
jgi:hypothetical protein